MGREARVLGAAVPTWSPGSGRGAGDPALTISNLVCLPASLGSEGCCNKESQAGWPKTTGIYFPLGLRARHSKCLRGLFLLGDSEVDSVPRLSPSFWWLLSILGISWPAAREF